MRGSGATPWWRRWLVLVALVAAANAPWLVAGALHAGSAFTDPLGARVFALADEGSVPGPLAALGLGGIWNSEVVPGSRTGVLGWVSLVLLLLLVGVGLRRWREAAGGRDVTAYAVCWGVGWSLAVLTGASPGVTGWGGEHLPGGGLVRDGARLLALCAPLLAAVVGHGAARVSAALPRAARPTAVLALLLLPVAVLPDVALGWSGRLTATAYPADYTAAREATRAQSAAGARGDVLLLPLSSYRQPAWNDGHKVLDPVGRFLTPDYVAADDLFVSGRRVVGEDTRVRAVAAALGAGDAQARSRALADLGVGFVVTEKDVGRASDDVPDVAGTLVHDGPDLRVRRLGAVRERATPLSWTVAVVVAWAAFGGLFLVGLGVWSRRAWRARRRPRRG